MKAGVVASESSLLEILEASPVGISIVDDDGLVMFWNSRLIDLLGGLQGVEFGQAAIRHFIRDDEALRAVMSEYKQHGRVSEHEASLITGDGSEVWVSVTMQRFEFEGRPAALTWFYDLTPRKRAEADLEESEDALLSVLEACPVGATVLDTEGRVMFWNSRLIDILGVQGEGFADAASLVFNGDTAVRDTLLREMDRSGRVRDIAISPLRPGGEPLAALVSMEPIVFERQRGVLTWIYDVSELRRAQEISEAATRSKSAFLATMSHEIRTPMNGVVTMAELLAETRLTKDQAAMVRTITESGQSLLTIINDILDFSKIEAGRLDIEILPCSPRRLVDGVAALLAPKAHEKGLDFVVELGIGVPDWIASDPTRLRQILLNLAGNAIKFTETGRVTVRVEATEIDRDHSTLCFRVIDTGIGISAEQQSVLFRAFSQADVSTARRFGGTGLGLSICKGLMDLLGGRIGVDSRPLMGSCFWFEVPANLIEAPAEGRGGGAADRRRQWTAPDFETAAAAGAVVLCAEDNQTNRDVLGRVLGRLGLAHRIVENGEIALQVLESEPYGLLLTDCHMPIMDGWDLARAIRAREARGKSFTLDGRAIPIIALTADAVKGTQDRCAQAGMDGYLTKPVAMEAMEATLARWIPSAIELRVEVDIAAESLKQIASPDEAIDLATLTELIGDDEEAIAEVLRDFLEMAEPLLRTIRDDRDTDIEVTHRAAHSLKSAARYIGAKDLGAAAAALEAAIEERDWDRADTATNAVDAAFDAVQHAIGALSMSRQLSEVRAEIGRMAVASDGGSSVDLEAVVNITEEAASRILEAAEAIGERIERIGGGAEAKLIQDQLTAIFEACSFQDLTSQRVRRAIARLATIEERLDDVVKQFGGDDLQREPPPPPTGRARSVASSQDEIDRLIIG